ncbi:tRNA (adenosine(37)-N6)-dimethylallyltransferase MiaA [Patescibacteria group bacterium]|nr:tRNA (adenosine(37)-N6)-dimethylallyltransferase MiaA [Patescibacteria group bacterium]
MTAILQSSLKLVKDHLASIPEGKIPLIVILGPTASGKTSLSVQLAKQLNGAIISTDSRQVYRGMDIGTDKITQEEMAGIPHHLLDVAGPDQDFTLANFRELAEHEIDVIHKKGQIPFLAGGTALYIDAITKNYDMPCVPPNKKLREKYEKMAEKNGKQAVYDYLISIDPENAEKIHPNNLRYVIRAIEIFETTGKPKQNKVKEDRKYHVLKIGINRPRKQLYDRINARVLTQVDRGILAELHKLLENCPRNAPSMSSLGYKEYFPYIDGKISLEEAQETLQKNTRNYAKRQMTWFRKDNDINWLNAD